MCLHVCDVTAAVERRGSPQLTRPGVLRSPPSRRCAMRHCGRSGRAVCLSVCLSISLSVCWREGHRHGLHHIKKRRVLTMDSGHGLLRIGGRWVPAGPIVRLHLAKTARDTGSANTRRHVSGRACACVRTDDRRSSRSSGSGGLV